MLSNLTSPLTLLGKSASFIYTSCVKVPEYLQACGTTNGKIMVQVPLWTLAANSRPFVRIAALSGVSAVILGAYGSHKEYPVMEKADCLHAFEVGNRYHFIHTLALLGLPFCRAPYIAATFLLSGIILFSGSCYYHAFTCKRDLTKFTPLGGVCFIIGWLSMSI